MMMKQSTVGLGGKGGHLEAGTLPRSCTQPSWEDQGPGQRLENTETICLSDTPQKHGSMGNLVNKHCFVQPFDEVKRMAGTGQTGNKKTKGFKKAKEA